MPNSLSQDYEPAISIIIVTWNSNSYLPRCLTMLAEQTFKDFEIILIDNGSTDSSINGVEQSFPSLNFYVKRLSENKGFAAANNLGASLAHGNWLALLNSDAFPEADWLEKLLKAAENNPQFSFFASRQLQANMPHLLDGAGDAYHLSGLAWRRYFDYPADQFGLDSEEVFSACAAAALYSRRAFLQVGGFDEDFFSYFEDVDLGFRLRLQGFRCLYVPDAIVKHVGSVSVGAKSDFVIYHWHRNWIWLFIKNTPSTLLWKALPFHLLANLVFLLNSILKRQGAVAWKAKVDAIRGLSCALKKRRKIQNESKVSSTELSHFMERGFLQPYLRKHNLSQSRWFQSRGKT